MKGITLIGMPGVGKSTIGKILAKKLNYNFVDLDILIKEKEGQSHDKIAREKGDSELLKLENLYTLGLDLTKTVFSPGGSIIYSPAAMEKLKKETLVVFLDMPLGKIQKRLGKNPEKRGIVGFKEKGLGAIYKERTSIYAASAHHRIDCAEMEDGVIVDRIRELI